MARLLAQSISSTPKIDTKGIESYFQHFDWKILLNHLWSRLGQIIFLTLILWLISRIGLRIIGHAFRRYFKVDKTDKNLEHVSNRAKTIYSLVTNLFRYTILFFWIYALLSTLGVPVGTLVASAGIFSLAIGLGAQGFVSDLVTGVSILVEQQFDVGDIVTIGTITGRVTSVGLRITEVTALNGTVNFIPNRDITIVSNMSRNPMRAIMQIFIYSNTPIEKLNTIITQVNNDKVPNYPDIIGEPSITGTLQNQEGILVYQVVIETVPGKAIPIQADFLAAYLSAIQKAGISLPTVTQAVNVNNYEAPSTPS
ncbi:mechanosensitive ion channel family protein [Levilactobacillus bambusae]|uniref:Mechanosensitive ion channel protein MscS n=1 Tax=Levilactobacillus bambusae TaxID=2024736 RepID=A0A2V1MX47_9LACO|nr:mechanosensitive ion channel family protein [Levilactobacillus bambusae]PWF99596.1 mechanosensitive ion channel protein MscS [Levilactobacillus bambusae]